MIFFLSPWFIFVMALFGAAGIYTIVQNIGIIILSFVVLYIVLFIFSILFNKWPARTIFGIILIFIVAIIALKIYTNSEINNTPVMLYRATDTCVIYDEMNELVQIPMGAIVARYSDPEIKSKEVSVIGQSHMCLWHYDGQVYTTTESIKHELDYYIKEGYEPNIWNLSEIKEITYKQFQKGNWWIT